MPANFHVIPRVMGSDVRAFSRYDGCDAFWLCDEVPPGVAGGVDDVVIGLEDEVGEPVGLCCIQSAE